MKHPLVKIKMAVEEKSLFKKKKEEKKKKKKEKKTILRGRTRFWLWLDSWALNAVFTFSCLIQCNSFLIRGNPSTVRF